MEKEDVFEQEYADAYNAFRNENSPLIRRNVQNLIVPRVIQNIKQNMQSENVLHILAVGCGYGDLDVTFIKGLLEVFPNPNQMKITYTVVDISKIFIDRFKEEVAKLDTALRQVEFIFIVQDFGDFIKDEKNRIQRYGVINFWHVLYYLDAENALKESMTHALKPGGCIVSITWSEDGFMFKTHQIFSTKIKGSYEHMSKMTDNMLADFAKKYDWKFEVVTGVKESDLTEIFVPESKAGSIILDFIFHRNQLVRSLQREEYLEILEHFKGLVYTLGNDQRGRKFANSSEGITFYYKAV